MELLEELYELDFKKIKTIPRRVEIVDNESVALIGPPKCGKTFLVYRYLSEKKSQEYIYIDLKDFRISQKNLNNLFEFVQKNSIKIVVFDNVEKNSDIPKLPNNLQIIFISTYEIKYQNIKKLYLTTLDFEEFLLFDNNSTIQITHTFNRF